MKIIFTLFIVLSSLLATEAEKNAKEWSDYVTFNVAASYVALHRDIAGAGDKVDSEVFPIFSATVGALFFPNTYDLKLSYTHNITNSVESGLYNPLNYDDSVSRLEVSVVPYYNSDYGGIGIFYTSAEQNSKYTNKTDTAMPISKYDWTDASHTAWGLIPITNQPLVSKSSYQSKEEFSYLGVKYMLPEYEYLPKGANVYYSRMDRTTVYFGTWGTADNLIYVSGRGDLYGFGLQRELHELPKNDISLDLLQISKGGFSAFPDLDLYEFSLGATYMKEAFYVKAFALVYIADEFNSLLEDEMLFIPRQTDTLINIKLGMSF